MKNQTCAYLAVVALGLYIAPSIAQAALAPSEYENYCRSASSSLNRVFINTNSSSAVYQFKDAVAQPNTVVCLGNVVLDFTNADMDLPLSVAAGVKILGTRSSKSLGAALLAKRRYDPSGMEALGDNISYYRDLLVLDGNNITLNGFRIMGGNYAPGAVISHGVRISSKVGIDIGNMEIAGWGIAAISIRDNDNVINRQNLRAGIYIHDSYLHHNQNKGEGYGVDIHDNAYALIENNLFDFNRHAIAADGQKGTGYYANRNLVLKGGGDNGINNTHQFDMHGTDPGTFHRGGDGGEFVELVENSMQYNTGNGYFLRGKPVFPSNLVNNFFAQTRGAKSSGVATDLLDYAIVAYGSLSNIIRQNNSIKYDTYGNYQVCDVDGNGYEDLLQPAGATWWYSGQAKYPWRYLERSYKTLSDIAAFADFDKDGSCDVLTLERYSIIESMTPRDQSGYRAVIYSPAKASKLTLPTIETQSKEARIGDFDGDGYKDLFTSSNNTWTMYSTRTGVAKVLNSSTYPLSRLAFGDFNGDKKTDVLSISDSKKAWMVSWSGSSAWQKLNNKLSGDIKNFQITDVNGDGKDDIVLVEAKAVGDQTGIPALGYYVYSNISMSGQGNWIKKRHYIPFRKGNEGWQSLRYFVGLFDDNAGPDLLIIDTLRNGYISSNFNTDLQKYSLFNY